MLAICEGEWKDFDSLDLSAYVTVAARNHMNSTDIDASARVFIDTPVLPRSFITLVTITGIQRMPRS